MWWVRRTLREKLPLVRWASSEELGGCSIGMSDFDADGGVDGTCTVRSAHGRRSLFFDLTVEARWRGVVNEGTAAEEFLCGGTQLWGIVHFADMTEWKHLNRRETAAALGGKDGEAQAQIATQLAPRMAAMLKVKVQEVMGMLMYDKIDPSILAPPAKQKASRPAPAPSVRKGTVDYSKWDHLSDSEEEEEEGEGGQRFVDLGEVPPEVLAFEP